MLSSTVLTYSFETSSIHTHTHITRVFLFSFTLASDSNTPPLHCLESPFFSLSRSLPGLSLSRLMFPLFVSIYPCLCVQYHMVTPQGFIPCSPRKRKVVARQPPRFTLRHRLWFPLVGVPHSPSPTPSTPPHSHLNQIR